ncbi:MAG: cobalt ECF transporter T component CbiQ [Nitriliruptoraceae bacterium]
MGAGHAHALYVHEHSVAHRLPAHVKIVATFAVTVLIATTPNRQAVAFAGFAVLLAIVARLSRIPGRFLLARLVVVAPFLLAALFLPFVASGPRVEVLGVSVAEAGLWGGLGLAARALLGATASLLLVATTEVPDLLRGLERLRVPALLTQIAAFMVRYLEVIVGEVTRQRRAMTARGYDPRWFWQLKPLAAGLGVLFVRSYERGERVHAAMLARGFTGQLPALVEEPPTPRSAWLVALAVPGVAVLVRLLGAVGNLGVGGGA